MYKHWTITCGNRARETTEAGAVRLLLSQSLRLPVAIHNPQSEVTRFPSDCGAVTPIDRPIIVFCGSC